MDLVGLLIRILGVRVAALTGDTLMFDRWRFLRRHLQPGAMRTLDAGCGSGAFLLYAGQIGNRGVGISFDAACNEKGTRRADLLQLRDINFITADLRELDKYAEQLGTFDQIICFETIEHIINDAKLIRDLSALLKPEGRILLTTPYKYYRPLPGDKISAVEDGGHVRWGYTHQEIKELFENYGLKITVEEYISGIISQKITHLIRLLRIYLLNNLATSILVFPLRLLVVFDNFFTRLLKYPYFGIAVVGAKSK